MLSVVDVSTEEALEIVRLFHAEYDRAMRQHVALGLLTIAGAFDRQGDDRTSVLLRVGAQMCGMIRDDVHLDVFAGKSRLLASSKDAAQLRSLAAADDHIARYVLARWHDAAARIWYRIGNHTRAMGEAGVAVELVRREPELWWCRADVESNRLRMQEEADKQVGRKTNAETAYTAAMKSVTALAAKHSDATREQRIEHLRGLWNLHHNRMVARGDAGLEASLPEFDVIRRAMREVLAADEPLDPYREAQTLNQEALQLKNRALGPNKDRLLFERSVAAYERLLQMPWPRGQFFARQHLPHLRAVYEVEHHSRSVAAILALCQEVRDEQARPGGREGFDLDRYHWTVKTAMGIAGTDDPAVQDHDLGVARAIQAIASVSAYKNAAQKFVLPALLRAVDRCLASSANAADGRARLAGIDDAVALIEEGSARELLDLLSTRRESMTAMRPERVFVPVAGLDPSKRELSGDHAERRNRRADLTPEECAKAELAVADQRNLEEEHWLGNPVPAQSIDPEISHLCRQFSAERFSTARGGPLLIRFFQREKGAYWGVAYFRGSTFGPVHLADKVSKALSDRVAQNDWPRGYDCQEIWDVYFEPILSQAGLPRDVEMLDRLVIVPCGELFSLPLHVALVPPAWTGTPEPRLLGEFRPLCFCVSLASHLLRNRAEFRSCLRQQDDDLMVLFAGEAGFREEIEGVVSATKVWQNGHVLDRAGAEAVASAVDAKPEFFVLQCHGSILGNPLAGSVLELHGGVLSNFGIATRVWLPRNKLTILGACLSGRPVPFGSANDAISPAGEIAGFIRGFIAAGCGALLVTNWSVRQSDLGFVTEQILRRLQQSPSVVHLDSLVRDILVSNAADGATLKDRIERSVFQLYL